MIKTIICILAAGLIGMLLCIIFDVDVNDAVFPEDDFYDEMEDNDDDEI